MPLKINGATNGSVTLAAPATGSDVTLTLPSSSGTIATTTYADASGLVKITDQAFSGVSTISVNNCFSSTYDVYDVFISAIHATTSVSTSIQLRASGTNAATNYSRYAYYGGVTSGNINQTAQTNIALIGLTSTERSFVRITLSNVFATLSTQIHAVMFDSQGYGWMLGAVHSTASSYDGFTFATSTGNANGNIRVYGYRN
jgi:hypothetical protein